MLKEYYKKNHYEEKLCSIVLSLRYACMYTESVSNLGLCRLVQMKMN